nr:immunoglobulin heavy chain junction region [Mus musculus]MBK4196860.1 immunoglobulin heavy chain junction region [Mus musculus]MBK4196863.1 immunoglobulin heavy chain junction region [Mus musculus]
CARSYDYDGAWFAYW